MYKRQSLQSVIQISAPEEIHNSLKVFNDELKNLLGTGLRTDLTAEVRIAGYKAMDLQSQGLGGLLSKQEINTDKKAGLENQGRSCKTEKVRGSRGTSKGFKSWYDR